ncbi:MULTISPECIES: non-ribosomal peptide synthetase [unclassified Brenneria]|uniref:non-ribosomal peptide synthetase n=1 Tax=unclassified Brenneria TaxID=2634434 RepID=UPI001551EA11|nr:non-ribosomal peptide synthetase [Brenneria sp. hezel4-2-4]MEE3650353.1 non-ribosomal peptide synthetase [Brenneria sp. HEZEL_4_2_4]NPD00309.1 amino acid adenylation domain-containing protein [Brenneria sp. hezel4-2-4]
MHNRDENQITINALSREEKARLLELAKSKGLKRKTDRHSQIIQPAARSPEGEPLAFAQRRLWFLAQMEDSSTDAYILGGAFQLKGRLDVAALRAALDRMIDRHEILRTRFINARGTPLQRIDRADSGFILDYRELQEPTDVEPRFSPRFDLEHGPLIGGQLVRVAEEVHLLRIAMHHIIADGWSIGVFMQELGALYAAFSQGLPDPLPALNIQYADYAAWQHQHLRGAALQEQQAYWAQQLRGIPACLTLPGDRPRPQTQDYRGAGVPVTLDKTLTAGLKALGQRHGCTLFMTLLAGWAALMSRLSGQDDVVIGTPIAGRNRREIESLIGMFVNTQALRVDMSGRPNTDALLAQVRATALAAQRHADMPFEQVVEALAPSRSLSHSPIFQVMLALQNTPDDTFELPGLTISPVTGKAATSQFDLSLSLAETGEQLAGTLFYATSLFDEATVQRYLNYWLRLLRGMAADPLQPVQSLPMFSDAERRQVLYDFNHTQAAYPVECCIHTLFERQAKACPDAVAVVYDDQPLSYGDLNARANQLAHWLVELGVRPDSRVAIALARGSEMVVAMLATLKAGGAYVPFDPDIPQERLIYMLRDSAPNVLIATRAMRDRLGAMPDSLSTVELDSDVRPWIQCPATDIAAATLGLTARHLAYVIYTSGSTGQPKGVMVHHQAAVNFLLCQQRQHKVTPEARLLAVTTISFDIHVLEIYLPLISGAQLHLASDALRRDGERLGNYLCQQAISLFQATPATWKLLIESGWRGVPGLKALIGGESFPQGLAAALLARVGELWNMYGPTETTVWSTTWRIDDADEPILIGRPIANTQVYLLDAQHSPVPVGVAGEIYIAGAGVTRGYLNRPQLTAERFLPDPFADEADARMYKTGDLGRRLADGAIEYLGRNDFQVKIRGFRIELGEIESALLACDGVREAVVAAVGAPSQTQDKRLVAYYVADGEHNLSVETLKTQLGARLPEYMVPAAYVRLERIPLTPNGKVNRKALPAPDEAAFARQIYQAPQGADEQALAALWQSLLGVDKVGRHDNFFALGGHSLLAVQLISRVRSELNRELALTTLFARPALSDLAAALGKARQESLPAIVSQPTGEAPPLSLAQQRLWFLAQMDEAASAAYVIAGGVRMLGELDITALQQALDRIVARHAALRTHIENRHGVPVQVIEAEDRGFPLSWLDAGGQMDNLPPFAPRFELTTGPLAQGQLVRVNAQEHWLRLAMHHIIADGWSIGVFMQELRALYAAFSQGRLDPLPRLPIQYGDYAVWQHQHLRGEVLHTQRQYWVEQLRGAPDCLTLPTDRPRPQTQSYAGGSVSVTLDTKLTAELKALSQRHGCTLFMTLLAGWGALMGRLSGQDDIVMGSPIAGRNRREIEPLIGMFVNTLALRIDLSEQPDTDALLAQVKATALAAQSHADIPFEQVVEALAPTRSLSHSPIFQVMLALQNTPDRVFNLPGLTLSALSEEVTVSHFDLSLELSETDGQLKGSVFYASALFDAGTVRRYLDYWQRLLRGMAAAPHQPVRALPILSAAERQQVLVDVNNTAMAYPPECCLHTLFEAQAAQQPEALALICDDRRLSYGELNARANQLAHWLIEQGVRPDSRVAIVLERSSELIVAMLATLKAGGAYVPLDPGVPPERLAYMVADSAPQVMIASRATRTRLGALPPETQLIAIDAGACPWADCARDNIAPPRLGLTPRHLAYIIYTSGSTGQPKGVMVEHRGVVNLVRWHCQAFGLRAQDAASCVAGLGFDAAVWEIWPPLSVGARLLLPSPAVSRDPGQLLDWWAAQPINVGFLPTPVAELAFARGLNHPTLRTLLVGGDRLNRRPAEGANFTLVNNYGPTENTVVATSGRICAADRVLHIGRPIANTRTYILDAEGQPAPMGVSGELYIGGAQVARGYLNRADLTAERFLPDPFADEADARMYKTGDLGRWLADGAIEYLGRNDFQVKIRGFRIELGEIESALLACEGVSGAVVTVSGEEKRLVAYYTADDATQATSIEGLKAQLGVRLPEYMVPAAYVRLERIPLTPNGKVDRKALPAPDEAAFIRQAYEAPQGADEQALAALWQSLLGLDKVGRHDNFFALGGHSLLAVQLISRVRTELDRELTLATLFARPVISELAAALGEARQGSLPAIVPQPDGETPPLSLAQQRLWFLAQMDEAASAAYVIAGGVRMLGKLDAAALQRALDRIVARHAALRTRFESRGQQPMQVIEAEDRGFPLSKIDINGESGDLAPFAPQFDLTTGPLAQGQLVRVNEQEHWLRLAMHHIIADGWSMGVFMRELRALYKAFSQGRPDPLPRLSIQYGDYAAWQHQHLRGEVLQAQQRYWVEQLRGAPDCLILPTDRPRPQTQSYAGASVSVTLDKALTKDLNALSQRHGCTLFMTLLAGWAALMGRLSGQDDIVMGSPIAGRNRREIEPLIGMFVNTQALRVDLSGQPDTDALLAQVKATALAAQSHADVPFEQVVEALAPARSLSHSPVFQVMLALQNTPDEALDLYGLTLSPLVNETTTAQFDLSLELRETNGQLTGALRYASALFDAGTVRRYLDYWQRLLRGMAAAPRQPVRALPILSAAERQRVLVDFNNTAAAYPSECCLHTLFEAQAARQPEALAIMYAGQQVSYGELNARANQLAYWLVEQGVRPDSRVAIALERGSELIVAMLATLKAGGAYVPLDPSYPPERLQFILADSAPEVLITDSQTRGVFDTLPQAMIVLNLDRTPRRDDGRIENSNPARKGIAAANLAYIMYTSGSTGQPKGVMVEHRNVVKLALNNGYADFQANDRVACLANPAFDASTMEIWGTLLNGGGMVIFSRDLVLDAERFAAELRRQQVSVMFMTIALFNQYAETLQEALPALRYLMVGGESLDLAFIRRVLRHGPPQHFLHVYGPTETTTFATAYRMNDADPQAASMPIGRPIANTTTYLLDSYHQPVPVGVAGEIHIGGAGVARGYLNLASQTAERFLADPFATEPKARMYKTGDLGRWRADGTIEFLGRNDFQVKIRGFRIELGEIESALQAIDGVQQAVVLARGDSAQEKRLVAYFTSSQTNVSIACLKAQLQAHLPEYMLPSAYVRLESIPLTPNGKVDRKALPEPDDGALIHQVYEAPQGEVEQILAEVWQSLLGVERVSRHDDFFALGGHSLMAVRLINEVRKQGIELALATLFAAPQLQALAARLQTGFIHGRHDQAIAFRSSGSQPPLFIVPEASGELFYGPLLTSCINSDIPVYGLAAPDRNQPTFKTLQGAAARYARMIRATQPEGPYRLLGWSFGGTLAYEIAAQLLGQDQQVEFLGMLDTRLPDSPDGHIVPLNELFAMTDEEDMLSFLVRGDLEAMVGDDEAAEVARKGNWRDHYALGQKIGMLPAGWSPSYYRNWLCHRLDLLRVEYAVPTLPLALDIVVAQDEAVDGGRCLGWDRVLPENRIQLIPVSGDHKSLVSEPYVREVGLAISDAIQARSQRRVSNTEASSNGDDPVMTLQTGQRHSPTLLCIPGAGDNVFAFMDLVQSLNADWTVLGLQPRGLLGDAVPHAGVEAAAMHYLRALRRHTLEGPVHLLGHSFGGWVALELAVRLEAEGISPASLTLADSDVPEPVAREYTDLQALMALMELFEMQGEALGIMESDLAALTQPQRLAVLHQRLIARGLLPVKAQVGDLANIFRVFATNIRTGFQPAALPTIASHLVLANDSDARRLAGWQALLPQLQHVYSAGNHIRLLKAPYVRLLADTLKRR